VSVHNEQGIVYRPYDRGPVMPKATADGVPVRVMLVFGTNQANTDTGGCGAEGSGGCGPAATCAVHPETDRVYLFLTTCIPSRWPKVYCTCPVE
jgi:hypothetical protein